MVISILYVGLLHTIATPHDSIPHFLSTAAEYTKHKHSP